MLSVNTNARQYGGLVISLDFELAWGVHDSLGSEGAYRVNLLGARKAVPRILELFSEFHIEATWATVGFLFAESREEIVQFIPDLKPTYSDPRRDPYRTTLGMDEASAPLHYAASLVRAIAATPGQEVASHTFSHYYCLEDGQTVEQFAADLSAAQAIARAKGLKLSSLVLPRHQNRSDYLPVIVQAGFDAYRSNEPNWLNRPARPGSSGKLVRAARLIDSWMPLTGANLVPWASTRPDANGLVDVRESRFLRPIGKMGKLLDDLHYARIGNAMRYAAKRGCLFHLWWHPHNFGARLEENLALLRRLLVLHAQLRLEYGFGSYSMKTISESARAAARMGSDVPLGRLNPEALHARKVGGRQLSDVPGSEPPPVLEQRSPA